jgi:F0F1-type ATP synthase membrane subunit b/b'
MDNDEVIGHLLKIESEASTMVDEAQAEADKRLLSAEKQNHAAFEERYSKESKRLETEFQAIKEKAQQQYQTELEACREKTAALNSDTKRFSALLDKFVAGEAS